MFEQVFAMAPDLTLAVGATVFAGGARCVLGWLENAAKDGKIEKFELEQLVGTLLQYFSYIFILSVGGLDIAQAVGGTFAIDMAKSVVKKLKY